MGDVARVLSDVSPRLIQGLMHDRLAMEACENVHLHWRNVRLEMSVSDALRMLAIGWRFKQLIPLLQGRVVSIPLAAICPYDKVHRRVSDSDFDNGSVAETARHMLGIAWIVEQMRAGKRTWPIAVWPAFCGEPTYPGDYRPGNVWQRLDGFKRYMAHKTLKRSTIECFIIAERRPGCQHGHRAFQEDGEDLPRGFPRDFFVEAKPDRLSLVDSDKQRYLTNQVELLKNGTIHVHMGDVRLEFTRAEFSAFADMLQTAQASL